MQRSNIEWCTHSWNPITGCTHGCVWCYARDLAEKRLSHIYGADGQPPFQPRYWPGKLFEPHGLKNPAHIFTVSMGDLFCNGTEEMWIYSVMQQIAQNSMHTFTILTKNPKRAVAWLSSQHNPIRPERLSNLILGTSITGALDPEECSRLEMLKTVPSPMRRVLSLEPMLHRCAIDVSGLNWVIVGGLTGKRPFRPPEQWIDRIIQAAAKAGTPVFVKNNALPLNATKSLFPRQYPFGVPHEEEGK